MNEHLVSKAASWFDDVEKWTSFLELCEVRDQIAERWLVLASNDLRNYFMQNPSPGWSFVEWESERDTWWYLDEVGINSIGIGFGWRYRFCFGVRGGRIDRFKLSAKLKEHQYLPLVKAFGRKDEYNKDGMEFIQYRDFSFGSSSDGRMPENEFAWYTGYKRSSFLEQCRSKIEAFTRSQELTHLLFQLNRDLLSA